MSAAPIPAATAATAATAPAVLRPSRRPWTRGRVLVHVFLGVVTLLWLVPLVYAVMASLRDYQFTAEHGYLSLGGFTLDNYVTAWQAGGLGRKFVNSAIITVPAVLLTLLLSSMVAFVIARFSWRINIVLLAGFTAANLLPPQALLIPLFKMFQSVSLPLWLSSSGNLLDTYVGLIAVNTAFQVGFCTFVLSNYMKALPKAIYESAMVDGASVWTQYWRITLPLCRPSLAALATLQVTWIYNEFFWATVLLQSGDKLPVTSSITNLSGAFFTDNNLVAAGSVLIALPTILIYFLLQKHIVGGLTLGATKG